MASGEGKLLILIWFFFQLEKVAQTVGKLIYVEVAPAARLFLVTRDFYSSSQYL